jgi:hypothetical protein
MVATNWTISALALTAAMVIAQSHPKVQSAFAMKDPQSRMEFAWKPRPPTLAKASPAVAMARA